MYLYSTSETYWRDWFMYDQLKWRGWTDNQIRHACDAVQRVVCSGDWHHWEEEDGFCLYNDEYEYADNWRFARAHVKKEVREYRERQARGCCGFYDTTINTGVGGNIMVGCNYGH